MKKICIIGTSNLKHISLISLYTHIFDELEVPYDLIYIDRYGTVEKSTAEHQYCYCAKKMTSKLSKIRELLKFRRFAKRLIKKNNYDLLITWQTTGAYLFFDLLLFSYRGRYIVNIRDYVIENNKFFYSLLKRLVAQSVFSTISSEGFLNFLPPAKYVKVNSINPALIPDESDAYPKMQRPYKIGFAGNCRYFNESYKLIESLKNDERFELWFCGTNSEVLKKYAECYDIRNVKTLPAFDVSETLSIVQQFDVINSAFGNDAMDNKTLLPIRLYLSVALRKPILATEETQLAKVVSKNGLGFVVKDYNNLADDLVEYIETLNEKSFFDCCDTFLKNAKKENDDFARMVRKCVKGE